MASEQTKYLKLLVFPDIKGVYQKDLREAYDGNAEKIDLAVKKINEALESIDIPIATTESAGKVIPDGDTILVDENGVIRAAIKVAIATDVDAGIVKPDGDTILIDEDGTIRSAVKVNIATVETAGIVKPDGESITIDDDGTIRTNSDNSCTKDEIETMMKQISEILISDTDFHVLSEKVDMLMGEKNSYSSLGCSAIAMSDLVEKIMK